jgi:WD40 repeat protein
MPHCPICNTHNTEQSRTCVTCGFDLSSYPPSLGIPQSYIELIQIKIKWAKQLWNQLQKINTENNHLEQRITALENQVIQQKNPKTQKVISTKQNKPAPTSPEEKSKRWLKNVSLVHGLSGHAFKIRALTISPDGQTLVSGSHDKTIKIWDLATGTLRYDTENTHVVNLLALSPDGKTLVTDGDHTNIKLWDLNTITMRHVLTGHSREVYGVAISPDSESLVTEGNDGSVKIWHLPTGYYSIA